MKSSVRLFYLVLLLKIVLQTECRNLETTSQSSSSNVSDTSAELSIHTIDNINDTELNTTKDERNSTINFGEPFGLIIETRSKRESSIIESAAMNTMNSTESKLKENVKDDENVNQTSARLEETIQEMFFEPWSRVKRDVDDGGCTEEDQKSSGSDQDQNSNESNSEEDAQNESSDNQNQSSNEVLSDYDDTDEDNDPSNESSKQVDPEGSSSTNEEVREERDVGESGETLEEGEYRYKTHPYWYRQPIFRRYWTSYERKSSRDFIKIPIFPGK